jgi:predicted nuclease with TOPRIM domain
MTEWQWVQIEMILGQVAVFTALFWMLTRDLKDLRREHYEHVKEVSKEYATKEELKDIQQTLNTMRAELSSRLDYHFEKLEKKLERLKDGRER